MKSPVLAALVSSVCLLMTQPRSFGAVLVDFTGGSGSPLSFTLPEVTFVMTNAAAAFDPLILVIETNMVPNWSSGVVTPTDNSLLWSASNPGISFPSNVGYNFYANAGEGNPFAGDVAWFGLRYTGTWVNGDLLTFVGGTALGGTATPPETYVDGLYTVSLKNISGTVVASVIPEPSTLATLVAGLALYGLMMVRRRRAVGQ